MQQVDAHEWWVSNLYDLGGGGGARQGGGAAEADGVGWWMKNLYEMRSGLGDEGGADEAAAPSSFAQAVCTPRGGPDAGAATLTPRGTLKLLGAVRDGGADGADGAVTAEHDETKMAFAADWVTSVFATPRGADGDAGGAQIDAKMGDALEWLQKNFATPRGDGSSGSAEAFGPPRGVVTKLGTPRNMQVAKESEDAVMAAAMQAVLATPRGGSVDRPMSEAVHKMFRRGVVAQRV